MARVFKIQDKFYVMLIQIWKKGHCVSNHSLQSAFLIIMNVRPWIFTPAALTGEWPGDVLLRAS